MGEAVGTERMANVRRCAGITSSFVLFAKHADGTDDFFAPPGGGGEEEESDSRREDESEDEEGGPGPPSDCRLLFPLPFPCSLFL